jgi:hypothetical protein
MKKKTVKKLKIKTNTQTPINETKALPCAAFFW